MSIRLGGVPEHFNVPILRALARLGDEGLTWTSVKGGTGAMMEQLAREELDVVFALTEGIVAALVNEEESSVRGEGVGGSVVVRGGEGRALGARKVRR
jgi:hypothetical protein